LEAAEEYGYAGTEDGYVALVPVTATGQTVLHHAATYNDSDVACELLSYSGAVAVARPFHWFTAVDALNVITPNEIATRDSSMRVSSLKGSRGVGTAVNGGLALAVKTLRDAGAALNDDDAGYADIAEAALASLDMDGSERESFPTQMHKATAMAYAMLLDSSFVVQLIDHWNDGATLEDGGDFTLAHVLDKKLASMRYEVETGFETSTDEDLPAYDDQLSSSHLSIISAVCAYVAAAHVSIISAVCAYVAAARIKWPAGALGGARTVRYDFDSVREGATGAFRQFRNVRIWLERYGPNGNGSLIFDYDPELERMWMDYRTRTQITNDIMTFMFVFVFLVVDLFKTVVKQTNGMMGFKLQLLYTCIFGVCLILLRIFPSWYSRHRETVIYAGRVTFMLSILGSGEVFQVDDSSVFRRNTLFVVLNMMPGVFHVIRADRHLLLQVVLTMAILFVGDRGGGGGHQFTWENLPLRSLSATASFMFSLSFEAQSRRMFALEYEQTLASKQRQTEGYGSSTDRRGDWFKWGTKDDELNKPATTNVGDKHTAAARKKYT
jgi:hypothetical protein